MKMALGKTKFKDAAMVEVSANPDSPDVPIGMDSLVNLLKSKTKMPERNVSGPLLFSVDHCFSIRGQGTVMTGTVLQGSVAVNDVRKSVVNLRHKQATFNIFQNVEIITIKETRKVKSMQMFKQPVQKASQGDRLGICVTQFDAKVLERGLVCSPGFVPLLYGGVIKMEKIPYFKGDIATRSKFHMSLGHETVLGKLTLFRGASSEFQIDEEYKFVDNLADLEDDEDANEDTVVFAIIEFDRPVPVVPKCKGKF